MSNFIDKYNKALPLTVGIALAALLKLNLPYFGPGFVIAVDVVVLSVFIYCFWDMFTPLELSLLSAVFSPIARLFVEYDNDYGRLTNLILIFPDAIFFVVYGLTFTLCVHTFAKRPMPLSSYLATIFISDFCGNLVEFSFMSMISSLWNQTISLDRIFLLLIIALFRTGITFLILVSIEYYVKGLLIREQQKKFNFLVNQSITISDEFKLIDDNKADVENVMQEAYALYSELKEEGYPEKYIKKTLDIARGAHEIKGAYQGVIDSLDKLRRDSEKEQSLKMSDILKFIKTNVNSRAEADGKIYNLKIQQNTDFAISESYKMISIIRNLVNNSIEAMDKKVGFIEISVSETALPDEPDKFYKIVVSDNGRGIPKENLKDIFIPGYSTKMNYETGYVQRGLGLPLIKEYIEYDFNGILEIESEVGKGTTFTITIPADTIE